MRLVFGLSAALLATAAVQAQDAEEAGVLDAVYACSDVEDATARLACFDAAVGELKSSEAAGEFVAVDSTKAREVEREAFGFNLPSLPKIFGLGRGDAEENEGSSGASLTRNAFEAPVDNVELPIRRIATRPDGKNKRFYLENGQVWRQIDGRRLRVRGDGPFTAHIRRAALGSYLLQIDGDGPAVRVKREE
jgi:hypothetical protein